MFDDMRDGMTVRRAWGQRLEYQHIKRALQDLRTLFHRRQHTPLEGLPEELYILLMVDSVVEALIVDLLQWLAERERSYEEVMSAWRTSCPKLPVWEDANERGLVALDAGMVRITDAGRAVLGSRLSAS